MFFRLPLFLIVFTFSVGLVFGTDGTYKALKELREACKINSDQDCKTLLAVKQVEADFGKRLEEAGVRAVRRCVRQLNEIRGNSSQLTTKSYRQKSTAGAEGALDITEQLAVEASGQIELCPAQPSQFGPMGNGQPIVKHTLHTAIARCQAWPSKEVNDQEITDKIGSVRGLDSIGQGEFLEQGSWFVKTLCHRGLYQVWECVGGGPNNYKWAEVVGVFAQVYIDQGTMANRLLRISSIRENVDFNYVKDYLELIDPIVFGGTEDVQFQKKPFAVLFPHGHIPTWFQMRRYYIENSYKFGLWAGYYVICRPNQDGKIIFDFNNNIGIRMIPGTLDINLNNVFLSIHRVSTSLPQGGF